MTTMVVQEWLESELGWGTEHDGWSVHKTSEDLKTYVARYWQTMPDKTPSIYSRPVGSPELVEVPQTLVDRVEASDYGVRVYKKEW
jgi:hypothetical protein